MFAWQRNDNAFSTPGTAYAMGTPGQRQGLQKFLLDECKIGSYEELATLATKRLPLDVDTIELPSRHYIRTIFPTSDYGTSTDPESAQKCPLRATVVTLNKIGVDKRALVLLWSSEVGRADEDDPTFFPGNYSLTNPFDMPAVERLGGWSGVIVMAKNDNPRGISFIGSSAEATTCIPIVHPDGLGGGIMDAAKCLEASKDFQRNALLSVGLDLPPVLYGRNLVRSSWVLSMVIREAAQHYGSGEKEWPCGIVDLLIDDVTRNNSVLMIVRLMVNEYENVLSNTPSAIRIDSVGLELGINPLGKPWTRPTSPHPRTDKTFTPLEMGFSG